MRRSSLLSTATTALACSLVLTSLVAAGTAPAPTPRTEWKQAHEAARLAQRDRDWVAVDAGFARAAEIARGLDRGESELIRTLEAWAGSYAAQRRQLEALALWQEVVALREAGPEAVSIETASALYRLGTLYNQVGPYAEAERVLRRALALRESLDLDERRGPNTASIVKMLDVSIARPRPADPERAELLQRAAELDDSVYRRAALGRYYESVEDYDRALESFEAARALEQDLRNDPGVVAGYLTNIAGVHEKRGELDLVGPLYEQVLALQEQRRGAEHPTLAYTLSKLGRIYVDEGRFHDAADVLERAVELDERAWGERPHECGCSARATLVEAYEALGRTEDAERVRPAAAPAGGDDEVDEDDPRVAELDEVERRVSDLSDLGQFEQALEPARRALELREEIWGPGSTRAAYALKQLATLHEQRSRHAEALDYLRRAVERTAQASDGNERHGELLVGALRRLAQKYRELEFHEDADATFVRELELRESMGHVLQVARLEQMIGNAARSRADHEAASVWLERAVDRWRGLAGPAAPEVAAAGAALASSYIELQRLAEAEALLGGLIEAVEARGGSATELRQLLAPLVQVHEQRGAAEEAGRLAERVRTLDAAR